ncbi:major facilitator superfamily domain-containing protein 6 [Monomorium pharaonis]|uniref:major facilitator superfamily domain-containing protein 6 n=1 Tax=Monomorium pharaonis TaxID=307658 RepID=UPI0017475CF9|nr:major facilitator superfamily domain-containing protein 6 [Monomorium pharaonis]
MGTTFPYAMVYGKQLVSSSCFSAIFLLPSLPGPIFLDQHFQNVSCASLSYCDIEYHTLAIESCNGTKDTVCHWICKDMNFSVKLSFHADQQKVIISSDTACLLNINETSLCQRNITNYNCNITCDEFENQCVYTSITFWGFAFFWCLGAICYFISISLSDATCFTILGKNEQLKFGKQRLWATMGFGAAACLSGYLVDLWSQDEINKTYTPIVILAVILISIDLICCTKLEMPFKRSTTALKDVFTLLKSKSIYIFLCFIMFSGILNATKSNFLYWYLEDLALTTGYMSKIKLIEGLIAVTEAFGGEVVFFFFSGKILEKLGYVYTFILSLLCYALRLGLISLCPMPWWVLPIELTMYGPSYALSISTIAAYANVIAPPGASAVVQGFFQSMHDGLGYLVGSLIIGALYKKFDGTVTLRIFSAFAVLSALTYFILHILYLKPKTPGKKSVSFKRL